jgi:integrase
MRKITPLNHNNSIQLKFSVHGQRYSFNPLPGAHYSDKRALLKAFAIAEQIEGDVLAGEFDVTLNRYRHNEAIPQPKLTRLIEIWDAYVDSLAVSERTREGHYAMIRIMILKDCPSVEQSRAWYLGLQHLSPGIYNQRLGYLKQCLKWAVQRKLTSDNPFDGIKSRKGEKSKIQPFTVDHIGLILGALRHNTFNPKTSVFKHSHYADWVEFQFLTGCRPSESIGLLRKHLDFDRNLIEISSAMARGDRGQTNGAGRVRKGTKTNNSRYLPMTPRLRELLLPRSGLQADELVFTSPKGGALDDRMFGQRVWAKVLTGLRIEYRRFYVTRHTFASIALEQGTPIATVAYLLGHSDLSMVMRTYGHLVSKPVMPDILSLNQIKDDQNHPDSYPDAFSTRPTPSPVV